MTESIYHIEKRPGAGKPFRAHSCLRGTLPDALDMLRAVRLEEGQAARLLVEGSRTPLLTRETVNGVVRML